MADIFLNLSYKFKMITTGSGFQASITLRQVPSSSQSNAAATAGGLSSQFTPHKGATCLSLEHYYSRSNRSQ